MENHRNRGGRLAMLVALLVTVLGALVVGPASPAQAAPGGAICFPVFDSDGRVVNWVCVDIAVNVEPDPEPCMCPYWAIEILTDPVLPEDLQARFYDRLGGGLALLGQAAASENPRVAYRLRRQAEAAFAEAVRLGGEGAGYRLGQVGVRERDDTFGPQPDPWLEEGGAHLVRGLRLAQAGAVEDAMADFQIAYDRLAAG
jgi:hypothetical protein